MQFHYFIAVNYTLLTDREITIIAISNRNYSNCSYSELSSEIDYRCAYTVKGYSISGSSAGQAGSPGSLTISEIIPSLFSSLTSRDASVNTMCAKR